MKKIAVFGMMAVASIFSGSVYAGQVTGTAKFMGTAPVREPLSMAADPTCMAAHPEPALAENVIANPNGTLKNVFVYVKQGLEGKTFPAPTTPATIDQKGCQYSPHVFGIQAGQNLEIVNSDNTLHNIHSMAEKSKQFNLGMPIQGMKLNKKFENPEVMVHLKCDVHPWMSAYIGVLPHSFYGVSGDDGSFSIKDLPAGRHEFKVWHEVGKMLEKSLVVTVKPGDNEITIKVAASKLGK